MTGNELLMGVKTMPVEVPNGMANDESDGSTPWDDQAAMLEKDEDRSGEREEADCMRHSKTAAGYMASLRLLSASAFERLKREALRASHRRQRQLPVVVCVPCSGSGPPSHLFLPPHVQLSTAASH